jgi:hypothetical protein
LDQALLLTAGDCAVLAYVFWHRPRDGVTVDLYEDAEVAFHRSLERTPPVGLLGSAAFRVADLPWLAAASPAAASPAALAPENAPDVCYEDWYFVEDYTALGVLNEAAVGRGHRSSHDKLAHRFGAGAGGLYGLLEGHVRLEQESLVIWVSRPPAGLPGSERRALPALLGDGMDPENASLWRRQFVFGPAPEYCLLAPEPPSGLAPTRLPRGWRALTFRREALWTSG